MLIKFNWLVFSVWSLYDLIYILLIKFLILYQLWSNRTTSSTSYIQLTIVSKVSLYYILILNFKIVNNKFLIQFLNLSININKIFLSKIIKITPYVFNLLLNLIFFNKNLSHLSSQMPCISLFCLLYIISSSSLLSSLRSLVSILPICYS